MTLPAGNSHRRGAAGFTLVELAVVVFILASILAIAAPSFVRSYRSAQLNAVARSLATVSQLARLKAALHQQVAELHVDLEQQRIWLTQTVASDEEGPTDVTRKVIQLGGFVRLVAAQKSGATVQREGDLLLVFYPNGTCDGGTIWLQGADKEALTVVFDPVTARATAFETRS